MKRSILMIPASLAVFAVLAGCGGKNSNDNLAQNPYYGTYRASYTRADGNVLVYVQKNGQALVRIFDSTAITPYEAMVTIQSDGRLVGNATSLTSSASFNLDIDGHGSGSTLTGTAVIEGDTVTLDGGYVGDPAQNMFAGTMYGLLTPTVGEAYNMEFAVTSAGTFNLTLTNLEGDSYTGTGTVDALGKVNFSLGGTAGTAIGKNITGQGYLFFEGQGIHGVGSYSGSGGTGTWDVRDTPPNI